MSPEAHRHPGGAPDFSSELVSVVIPVKDRETVIGESVRSVLSQTHRSVRVIVVDDGSADTTVERVRALKDPRVHVELLSESGGASAARNRGLDVADTRLVAFQDSDDVWHHRKLEFQLRALDYLHRCDIDVGAVGCNHLPHESFSSDGTLMEPGGLTLFRGPDVLTFRSRGNGTPKLLIDRERTDRDARFDLALRSREENDYLYCVLGTKGRLAVVDLPLLGVRRNLGDHVANPQNMLDAYERLLRKHQELLSSIPGAMSTYHHLAGRAALSLGERRRALQHFRRTPWWKSPRIAAELALGSAFGRNGLRAASLVPTRKP